MKFLTAVSERLRVLGRGTPRRREMKLFTTIYDDARLLGHFLAHYDRAGVTQFFIAVADGHGAAVRQFMPTYDITLCEDLGVADKYPFGVNAATEMRARYQRPDEWAVMVDLDEFVEFPRSIFNIIADADQEDANIVQAIMYDRFALDGMPRGFDASTNLSEAFPVRARFMRTVGGADHKGVLVKGHIKPAGNFHNWDGQVVYSSALDISHYKWTDRIISRVQSDYRVTTEAGIPCSVEYQRVLEHFEQHGRFAWEEFGGEVAASARVEV